MTTTDERTAPSAVPAAEPSSGGYDAEPATPHGGATVASPSDDADPFQEPASATAAPTETAHTEEHHALEEPMPALPARHQDELSATADQAAEEMSPEVAALKGMFPDFDPMILQSVLESVGGNQDRAIDMLLGMSDPEYVSQAPQEAPQSQTDLDEELARRLMLEEEQQQQQWQRQAAWNPRDQSAYGGMNVPYQPRMQRPPQNAPQSRQEYDMLDSWGRAGGPAQGQSRDTMAEVQEGFKQMADAGKKTFNSLMTRVKASINSSQQGGAQQQPQQQQQGYYGPPQQQQAYGPPGGVPPEGAAGYDAAPHMSSTQPPIPRSPRPVEELTNPGLNTTQNAPARSPSPQGGVPRPPSTSSGPPAANIDPAKLGMLPKRPVSLIASPQLSHAGRNDDDDLDYVDNPFDAEDRR